MGHCGSNERDLGRMDGEGVMGIVPTFSNKICTAVVPHHFHADYCLTRPFRRSCIMFLTMSVVSR